MRISITLLTLFAFLAGGMLYAQGTSIPEWAQERDIQKEQRMAWWQESRFGMFVHWGLYAVPARHEWVQNREEIPYQAYRNRYFDLFDPDLYDPVQWAAQAKAAGMKYVVLTARHHEGFSLWDTEHSDFKSTNTPIAADLIKPFVEACRAEGLRIGFYFSLIDWHHPDFTIDRLHPQRRDQEARSANSQRDMGRFRDYLKNQLTELLTEYGEIDLLFFDYSYPGEDGKGHTDWDSEGLLRLARNLQPGIVVNDRLDLNHTSWGWDYVTPEQFMPNAWPERNGRRVPWETCQTFSGSWGYHRDEKSWKSSAQLISMLVEVVSKGGNLLLNVGPTARGNFDARASERLQAIGDWMKYNGRSIYGCTAAPSRFQKPDNALLTYNATENRLYVHLLHWPYKTLYLPGFNGLVRKARFLHDGSEVRYTVRAVAGVHDHMTVTAGKDDLIVDLPVDKPNVEIPVIELILDDLVKR